MSEVPDETAICENGRMLRLGGFASVRRKILIALPLAAVMAITTTAAYAGLVSRISDERVTESSALAVSIDHPGYAYTLNDDEDANAAIVYTIKIATGAVVGTTKLSGVEALDPEALALDRSGRLWFADIGKDGGRANSDKAWDANPPTLYRFTEPSTVSGNRIVNAVAYPLAYPGDKHWDAETLLIHPTSNVKYLITKDADAGKRLVLPSPLVANESNLVTVREDQTDNVSDGSFTPNGKWAVIRSGKKVYVLYPSNPWRVHATLTPPAMVQPESLSFDSSGSKFLIGSEGVNSPLYWVKFDQKAGDAPKS